MRYAGLGVYCAALAVSFIYHYEFWWAHYQHWALVACLVMDIVVIGQFLSENANEIILEIGVSMMLTGCLFQVIWTRDVKSYWGYVYVPTAFAMFEHFVNGVYYTRKWTWSISIGVAVAYALVNHYATSIEMAYNYPISWWEMFLFCGMQAAFDLLVWGSSRL